MISLHHHIRHHATRVVHHIHKHHKKYLLAWGVVSAVFFAIKFSLFLGWAFFAFSSHDASFAQEIVGSGEVVVSTGTTQTLSGDVSTGDVLTGSLFSWDILTGTVFTGAQSTGETVEEVVVLSGVNTGIVNTGLTITGVLDSQAPLLTGLVFFGASTGSIFSGTKLFLSFESNELLSGVQVMIGSGVLTWGILTWVATGAFLSGVHYMYSTTWNLPAWFVSYSISFADIVGNTGYITGTTQYFVDTLAPVVTGLFLTGSYTGLSLQFSTTEPTIWSLSGGIHAVTTGWRQKSGTTFITRYSISLPAFSTGFIYDLPMVVKDAVGNMTSFTVVLVVNGSGVVKYSLLGTTSVYTLNNIIPVAVSTGLSQISTWNSILSLFKSTVVDDFNTCKNNLKYVSVKMQLKGVAFTLQMPQFAGSDMKKLVSAFSIYILNKMNSLNKIPEQSEIDDLTRKFNSFLVIMKLVNEDDNTCKQTLTTFHMAQFESALKEYGIRL